MDQDYFQQRMRLFFNTSTGKWFSDFVDKTCQPVGAKQVEQACTLIQNQLFAFSVKVIREQKDDVNLFEFDLHEYHRLPDLLSYVHVFYLPNWQTIILIMS